MRHVWKALSVAAVVLVTLAGCGANPFVSSAEQKQREAVEKTVESELKAQGFCLAPAGASVDNNDPTKAEIWTCNNSGGSTPARLNSDTGKWELICYDMDGTAVPVSQPQLNSIYNRDRRCPVGFKAADFPVTPAKTS